MAKIKKANQITINQVNVRPVNRQNPDIAKWRSALKAAENGSYNRSQLYDIYSECLLDGHLASVVEKRINAVLNVEISFTDKNKLEVPEIKDIINTSSFENILKEIIKAKFYGFSLLEISFDGLNLKAVSIDRRHVKPEYSIVCREPSDTAGIFYSEFPNVIFVGEDKGYGLLLECCPYVIYKRGSLADWAEYNEIFGMPYPQGSYDNADTADLLSDAFDKAGFERYVVAPKDAVIEFNEAGGNGSGSSTFETFKKAMDDEISVRVLGQTNTTTIGEIGSYAGGKVHAEIQNDIYNGDKEFLIKILNEKLIPVMQQLGIKADGKFTFVYADQLPLEKRIVIDSQLNNIVPIDPTYFYETYNVKPGKPATPPQKTEEVKMGKKKEKKKKDGIINMLQELLFKKKKKVLPF